MAISPVMGVIVAWMYVRGLPLTVDSRPPDYGCGVASDVCLGAVK